MSREKTDSITHLVKIVAREIMEEYTTQHINTHLSLVRRIDALEKQVKKLFARADNIETVHDTHLFTKSIQDNIERAGRPWTADEDDMMAQELRTAVATIARNHKRSIGAIKTRIAKHYIKKDALAEDYLNV